MAFLKFAGDPRKLNQIYASIDAGEQLKRKQEDTGTALSKQEGISDRTPGSTFEEVGGLRSEFAQAVTENPDYFYGDFMPRLLKQEQTWNDVESGLPVV